MRTVFIAVLLIVAAVVLYLLLPQGDSVKEGRSVTLYYYNSALDSDEKGNVMCTRAGLAPVTRTVPEEGAVVEEVIHLLLRGEITDEERAQGISTEFPLADFELVRAEMEDGALTLVFSDPENQTSGGSCRASVLWFQIEETAKQFPGVKEVHFSPEELFQP